LTGDNNAPIFLTTVATLNSKAELKPAAPTGHVFSLRRLKTEFVDLYQVHRWDDDTPIEETLVALHDVVKMGKARYIGATSMSAWQFCKALYIADRHGGTRFVSMQPHYNLLNREEEREM
jgi:aryl-alcohol dehydrogenase-like predicted oxidoreductase